MQELPIAEGIFLGLTLAVMLGPSFFALLQTSIHRGFRSGMLMAVGIVVSDFVYVALSYFGLSQLLTQPSNSLLIGIIGGIILISFGVVTFTRHPNPKEIKKKKKKWWKKNKADIEKKDPGPLTYISKGFFLNFANPFVIIFWMSAVGVVGSKYGIDNKNLFVFFTGTLVTVFATDLIKCFIANKLKRFLTERFLLWMNRVTGVLLVGFGLFLIIRVILTYTSF